MAISIVTATRNNALDEITADVGANGRFRIYDGTPPASANAALSGNTLLVDLPCSATFAAAAAGGVLTANAITTTNAAATGTATFFRVLTSGAAAHRSSIRRERLPSESSTWTQSERPSSSPQACWPWVSSHFSRAQDIPRLVGSGVRAESDKLKPLGMRHRRRPRVRRVER